MSSRAGLDRNRGRKRRVSAARAESASITAQVAGRPVGIIQGIAGSFNPCSSGALAAESEVRIIVSPAIFTSNTRTGRAMFLTCC